MSAIPAPSTSLAREEWPDADFDLPDGEPIRASEASDKEDEDWDIDMDLGSVAVARPKLPLNDTPTSASRSFRMVSQMFTIRPPVCASPEQDDEDDEGVSTIKVTALPRPPPARAPVEPIDEDFEDGFVIPSELTKLSLRPSNSLLHRSSKTSLEWGDRDQTSSSQSSDAYSTFGFADNEPSSNYTSASLPETETEEDEEEDELDGLVIPSGLFESGHGAKKLNRLLEKKKKEALTDDHVKVASPDPEDDFEIGLVIDNDVALSPSRLLQTTQTSRNRGVTATNVPSRPSAPLRPPSRLRNDRAKSPNNPPISSVQQLRKLGASSATSSQPPSPPQSLARPQTYSQAVTFAPASNQTFLAPKPGSLRVQKSHTGLKPASPPSMRKIGRKASLPSLSESNQAQASGSGSGSGSAAAAQTARYDAPTASSRAKTHTSSTSRLYAPEFHVPPTRPSTPSSNPTALRLTLPSRLKSRTPITSVFPTPTGSASAAPRPRSASPLPPVPAFPSRPQSVASMKVRHAQTHSLPTAPTVKVLKKPKRQKTYGDGTELDGFEDLPLDREKEGLYRVQPKGYGNRIPGASYPKGPDSLGKGTQRKKTKRELSSSSAEMNKGAPPTKTLKRASRLDFPAKLAEPNTLSPSKASETETGTKTSTRKKIASPSPGQTRRKPTLIRNLGGAGPAKVVGEMKWNPITLRWEGNDQVLKDFDAAVGTSTRPALITHLTGSSIGSPVGSFAAGARVVGTMVFDPAQMRWISTLPPEEDEPDVFADLADDEDDDWEAQAGTIRASQQLLQPPSQEQQYQQQLQLRGTPASEADSARMEVPSSMRRHVRANSESESDRCSRASMVCEVDDAFAGKCRIAEERHRSELKGWLAALPANADIDRSYLYEIRALATRQY